MPHVVLRFQAAIGLPLLHIADPTAARIKNVGLKRIGLLGTAFTMEQTFYKGRLADRHGLEVLVPEDEDRALVHRVIYEELVQGLAEPSSRQAYRDVIARLVDRGAEGVILGCGAVAGVVESGGGVVSGLFNEPFPAFERRRRPRHGRQ